MSLKSLKKKMKMPAQQRPRVGTIDAQRASRSADDARSGSRVELQRQSQRSPDDCNGKTIFPDITQALDARCGSSFHDRRSLRRSCAMLAEVRKRGGHRVRTVAALVSRPGGEPQEWISPRRPVQASSLVTNLKNRLTEPSLVSS